MKTATVKPEILKKVAANGNESAIYSVIMLSGGKGKRMEKDLPKQYLLLAGKPIIMHSLERIDAIDKIKEIIIVCETEYIDYIKLMIEQYNITTPIIFAEAGSTRQASVYSGLRKVSYDNVIIHEAARPFVKREDFVKLIDSPTENAILGYPIPFTVVSGQEKISGTLNRENLVNVQLPQKFKTATLKKAHEAALRDNKIFTEDSGMVYEYMGIDISIIRGTAENIKLTEPIDLIIGEMIYNEYIKGRR